jgi:hypothetical protein
MVGGSRADGIQEQETRTCDAQGVERPHARGSWNVIEGGKEAVRQSRKGG